LLPIFIYMDIEKAHHAMERFWRELPAAYAAVPDVFAAHMDEGNLPISAESEVADRSLGTVLISVREMTFRANAIVAKDSVQTGLRAILAIDPLIWQPVLGVLYQFDQIIISIKAAHFGFSLSFGKRFVDPLAVLFFDKNRFHKMSRVFPLPPFL